MVANLQKVLIKELSRGKLWQFSQAQKRSIMQTRNHNQVIMVLH
jgi:hypothetical protein